MSSRPEATSVAAVRGALVGHEFLPAASPGDQRCRGCRQTLDELIELAAEGVDVACSAWYEAQRAAGRPAGEILRDIDLATGRVAAAE